MTLQRFMLCAPFPERVRYQLLKLALDSPMAPEDAAAKIGMTKRDFAAILFKPCSLRMSDIAEVVYAYGAEPHFKLIPREELGKPCRFPTPKTKGE